MQKIIAENIKVTTLNKSKVEISGKIETGVFSMFRKKALDNINNEITIDGFRKGKVPENILISKIGEMSILEEMAELAISQVYPEIVLNNKIEAIGRPEISITKLAKDNPLEFKIITAVIPEIKLSDYKKIAKEIITEEEKKKTIDTIEVTDKEVADAMEKIKSSHKDHTGHDHDSPEVKEKIKNYLLEDKKSQAREKRRITIFDKLIETSTMDIPDILIESELKRIESQFTDDIKRMNVKLEDYLTHAKKNIEEIRKEWKPYAEKKAKLQLILNKIADQEKIIADKADIENEVKHILNHYKDANKESAYTYAETVLTNDKVFQFLENQK